MKVDWRTSPAHLLFLSKFMRGRDYRRYNDDDRWAAAFGEPPATVLARFLQDGLLQPTDIALQMDYKFKVPQLKTMLKERRLTVSGQKGILIRRLIEVDRTGMEELTRDDGMVSLSALAAPAVNEYLAIQEAHRKKADRRALDALLARRYREASQVVAAFEASQVFQRGVGVDWKNYDHDRQAETLRYIFERTPHILSGMEPKRIDVLRPATAMMCLWGENHVTAWLPAEYDTAFRLDADAAARMLLFHAYHLQNVAQWRADGVNAVMVSGVNDGNQCVVCRKLDSQRFTIDDVPEFPVAECTCARGCRCHCVVVVMYGIDFEASPHHNQK